MLISALTAEVNAERSIIKDTVRSFFIILRFRAKILKFLHCLAALLWCFLQKE